MRNWVILTFLVSVSFGQIIYHQPVHTALAKSDLPIEAIIDDNGYGLDHVYIFFRTINQFDFIHIEMDHLYGDLWQGVIPYNFLYGDMIEYYVVAEVSHGGIISYPLHVPSENPLRTRLDHNFVRKPKKEKEPLQNQSNETLIISGDDSGALILFPEPNEFIQLDDVMIAISLMTVDDIDYKTINAEINGRDVSNKLSVQGDIVTIIPENLSAGTFLVKIFLSSKAGIPYEPVAWKFIIVLGEVPTVRSEFKQSGKLSADRTQAEIDQQSFDINNYNLEWKGVWDYANLKLKTKLTSLNNPLHQSRNRYTASFSSPYLNIKLGDVNPKINEYAFNGYRIRGLDFVLNTKYFDLSYAKGQVLRPLQGDPLYDAMFVDLDKSSLRTIIGEEIFNDTLILPPDTSIYSLSEFISEVQANPIANDFNLTDSIHFVFNRSNYEFQQDIEALNLNIGIENRLEWNLNVIKVKDNPTSINNFLGDANIWLNKSRSSEIVMTEYFGDDTVSTSDYTQYRFMEYFLDPDSSFNHEVTQIITYDSVSGADTLNNFEYFDAQFDTLQFYEFTFADFFKYDNNIMRDDLSFSYELLDKDWGGSSPQDNLVIGSDLKFSFDRQKINVNAGFALSMYNQNIWDPVITKDDLDTLFDDTFDGYMGRIYDNNNIISSGMSLDEINIDPEKYSKYFHMNFNQIPISPIDVSRGEIGMNEIMTMPSLSYHLNLRLFYGGHSINYAFRQVGPEFMSLVNPFIQRNIRETQISDRVGLFQNRLYLNYKWKNSIDGIDPTVENLMESNNQDININLYPGIGMPTFSFGVGIQNRTNDITEIAPEILLLLAEAPDTVINWDGEHTNNRKLNVLVTSNLEFLGKHSLTFNIFESNKIDHLASSHLKLNPDYISQSSKNKTYSLNIKSKLFPKWESITFLNTNKYSLGEGESFQEQNVLLFDFTTIYKHNKDLKYFKNGINYTKGSGTSEFSQFSYKLGFEYEVIDQLVLRTNYELRFKSIGSKTTNNSMIIFNLGYRF